MLRNKRAAFVWNLVELFFYLFRVVLNEKQKFRAIKNGNENKWIMCDCEYWHEKFQMRREREWWRWTIIDIKCAILLQIKQSKNNRNCNCKIIRFYLWWKLCLHKTIVAAIVFYGNWGELKICKNAERKQLIQINTCEYFTNHFLYRALCFNVYFFIFESCEYRRLFWFI